MKRNVHFSDEDLADIALRFWSKVKKTRGCWIWKARTTTGSGRYGALLVKGARMGAHIVSFIIHNNLSNSPKGYVLHKCDNGFCVNPNHLYEGTHTQNMHDMYIRKRSSNMKLTVKEVRWCKGKDVKKIVARLLVSKSHAYVLRRGTIARWAP